LAGSAGAGAAGAPPQAAIAIMSTIEKSNSSKYLLFLDNIDSPPEKFAKSQ
jgi:hypothetical protein